MPPGAFGRSKQGKARTHTTVLPVNVQKCRKNKGLFERFFEYKFSASQPDSSVEVGMTGGNSCEDMGERDLPHGVLDVLVMANSICVLTSPYDNGTSAESSIPIVSVSFLDSADGTMELSTDEISGKRKKGAKKIAAGHHICTFTYADGRRRSMLTPINGMVLELNIQKLKDSPELVQTEPLNRGYIAVIFPDDDMIPHLENDTDIADSTEGTVISYSRGKDSTGQACSHGSETGGASTRRKGEKLPCYAFSRGACLRGDRCRWAHIGSPGDVRASKTGTPDSSSVGDASKRPRFE